MLFNSYIFIFLFFPICLFGYYGLLHLKRERMARIFLVIMSFWFYGYFNLSYLLIMICSIAGNYLFHRALSRKRSRVLMAAAVAANLGVLFYFKYFDFFLSTVNTVFGSSIALRNILLPLGISFFTFQQISFIVDTYRGEVRDCPLIDYALFVAFFPQLIAGPIVRYQDVSGRMGERKVRIRDIENGLKLFTMGLGLKVILANQIGTLWNVIMTAGAGRLHVLVAWLGAFAYSFQIYFDFWGYSVMAMGLGKMLGFSIPRNFNNPYVSRSVSEFWRRWHITLGSWFREYVYIPLGGNRKGSARTVLNLLVVWALTGLWHGADWNFVLWGTIFFLLISLEKRTFGKWLENSKVLGHIYLILLIPATWVVFAITDMGQLGGYLGNLIGYHKEEILVGMTQLVRYLKEYAVLIIACVIFATPLPGKLYWKWKDRWFMVLLLLIVFWWSVREIISGSNNPFLYFRF